MSGATSKNVAGGSQKKPKGFKSDPPGKTVRSYDYERARSILNSTIIKKEDSNRVLPQYSTVLNKISAGGNVGMEDINQLQVDLEKLLSNASVRRRFISSELDVLDGKKEHEVEEEKKGKKGKAVGKQQSQRRKRPKYGKRPTKLKCKQEERSYLPRNDVADNMWSSTDDYCGRVTKDDAAFLDDLIQEFSQETDVQIPEVGVRYSEDVASALVDNEQDCDDSNKGAKKKTKVELKKISANALNETFSSPLTQRLMSALVEVNPPPRLGRASNTLRASDFCMPSNPSRNSASMEQRLREELFDLGIFDENDLEEAAPPDEILLEIKKCSEELKAINGHNMSSLTKLRMMVAKDLRRQEVQDKLSEVDSQILELHNKILLKKDQDSSQSEEDLSDPHNEVMNDYTQKANRLLHQQSILSAELRELMNATTPA